MAQRTLDFGIFTGVLSQIMAIIRNAPEGVQKAVEKKVCDVDRNFLLKALRRLGFTLWTILVLITGAFLAKFGEKLFELFPHAK